MVSLGGTRIVVATQPVDFRKGHDGLAAVVQNELGLDPYSGVRGSGGCRHSLRQWNRRDLGRRKRQQVFSLGRKRRRQLRHRRRIDLADRQPAKALRTDRVAALGRLHHARHRRPVDRQHHLAPACVRKLRRDDVAVAAGRAHPLDHRFERGIVEQVERQPRTGLACLRKLPCIEADHATMDRAALLGRPGLSFFLGGQEQSSARTSNSYDWAGSLTQSGNATAIKTASRYPTAARG